MALPRNVSVFTQEMSPFSELDWFVDASVAASANATPLLDRGEEIDTLTLAESVEALALGVVLGTGERGTRKTADNKGFIYFLSVLENYVNNAAFAGTGVTVGIEATITTTSVPARKFKKTFAHIIANQ